MGNGVQGLKRYDTDDDGRATTGQELRGIEPCEEAGATYIVLLRR
jgi:hypothetical protein